MKKLFILFLIGICSFSSFAQRQDQRRGGGSQEVTVKVGSITNVTWQSDTTYIIDAGTNTVQTRVENPFLDTVAPILITNKQNITIRGLGNWNSVIFSAQTGMVMKLRACTNVTIENLAFEGTRSTTSLIGFDGEIHGCIYLETNNVNININSVKLRNQFDHGVYGNGSSRVIVQNSYFENVGSTNNIGCCGRGDGAVFVAPGPFWAFENNYVTNCNIGVELFNAFAADRLPYGRIVGNTFLGMHGEWLVSLGAVNEDQFTDVLIADNVAIYNPATFWPNIANGVALKLGKRFKFVNNHTTRAMIAYYVNSDLDIDDWIFEGNTIHGVNSQGIYIGEGVALVHGIRILDNIITRTGNPGIQVQSGRYIDIEGNSLRDCSTNLAGYGAIALFFTGSGLVTTSNRIANNRIFNDPDSNPTVYDYGISIDTGVTWTRVEGNDVSGYAISPINNLGSGSLIRDNWFGTNYVTTIPTTNSYSGTNVHVNLSINSVQVLVATNNMLIVWTNTSTMPSGENINLSIYNNTATNISIWHAAGVRFMGGASNIVNAGKELAIAAKRVGTNISLSFSPQVN